MTTPATPEKKPGSHTLANGELIRQVVDAVTTMYEPGDWFEIDDLMHWLPGGTSRSSVTRVLRDWSKRAFTHGRSRHAIKGLYLDCDHHRPIKYRLAPQATGPDTIQSVTTVTEAPELMVIRNAVPLDHVQVDNTDAGIESVPIVEVMDRTTDRYLLRIDGNLWVARPLDWQAV